MKTSGPTAIEGYAPMRINGFRPLRRKGFTLAEVMLAMGILALGFAGLWAALGQCLSISRAHMETIAATECLTQRVEQARAAGWTSVLTASGISGAVLNLPRPMPRPCRICRNKSRLRRILR